jgi:hypothetical protein
MDPEPLVGITPDKIFNNLVTAGGVDGNIVLGVASAHHFKLFLEI